MDLAAFRRRRQVWQEEHSEGRVDVDHVRRRRHGKADVLLASRWVMATPVKADDGRAMREATA
jgi:hypothetical protein